jgi:cytidylate kinase
MCIITIQRGTKSGGEAMAECLGEKLGYPLLGREVLQEAAAQLGVPEEDVGDRMEERPGRFGRKPLITKLYVAAVRAALVEQARSGNLVYHGLAGGLLLRRLPGVLRVRLIAPVEFRVRSLMGSHGMDEASAEAYIREVDEARAVWIKSVYGQDNTDSNLYDMVLNLEGFSVPEACEVVVAAASRPEFEMTPARMRLLNDFDLECQVRLALFEDLGTQTLDLDATVADGLATVTGEAPLLSTGDVGKRIIEIATSVPGIKEVRLALEWFDPYP